MRAVVMREFGAAEVLAPEEVATPAPQLGEIAVRVGAVAVSRTRDVATRTGRHPFSNDVTLPHVLGGDSAGTVEAVGPGVDPALIGVPVAVACSITCGACEPCADGRQAQCSSLEILGVHRWGSYAEVVTVPVINAHTLPDGPSMAQAAALAANGPVALAQLSVGDVEAGHWVVVTGVTGALGTLLAALAARRGARVIGVSRRPGSVPSELGIEHVLDATDPALTTTLMELTAGAGVRTVIDNVAAPALFERYFTALAPGGRVVFSGAIGTPELPVLAVPAAMLYLRSLSLLGVRTATPRHVASFWREVSEGFRLPASLIEEFALEQAGAAHARVASGEAVGAVVLTVGG
jgi:NADPH:quinone reductase-like Zn-dependent oxidoreductase